MNFGSSFNMKTLKEVSCMKEALKDSTVES